MGETPASCHTKLAVLLSRGGTVVPYCEILWEVGLKILESNNLLSI